MTLLVVHARLITMTGDDSGYLPDGWLRVDDGRITAVGAGEPEAVAGAEVLDVAGAFVAPGFVSAHSHLFTSGARGLGVADGSGLVGAPGSVAGWVKVGLVRATSHRDPRARSRRGYWETVTIGSAPRATGCVVQVAVTRTPSSAPSLVGAGNGSAVVWICWTLTERQGAGLIAGSGAPGEVHRSMSPVPPVRAAR
jgi:hypothetical protein